VTPKDLQQDAVKFLHAQLFQTPTWLLNREHLNRINNPAGTNALVTAQENILSSLVSIDRLNRLQNLVVRFGPSKAYGAFELLNDVQSGLFSELRSKKPIDHYRRGLQKSYVDKLTAMVNGPAPGGLVIMFGGSSSSASRSDLPAIARGQLTRLQAQVNSAVATAPDTMTRLHLVDLKERIRQTLDPK
jgi:hypothetical protein